ncbi:MAG: AarF/ABC1/UbiB kinase family protein [Chloroflexi bacterium]|nr:AarF/ABC1/UbiB kinase family protein [Chloroflexota bacterium]
MAVIQDEPPVEYDDLEMNSRHNGIHPPSSSPPPQSSMPQAHQSNVGFRENGRFRRILLFFGSIILHIVFWDLLIAKIPFVGDWVRGTRPHRFRRWAKRFRLLAVEMGGVMIKLGQFLSARVDVLPIEITEELQGLQDEVPAEQPEHILAEAEAELGLLANHFSHIEETPLAAASLGQAHRAWLLPNNGRSQRGDAVVIKVMRPNIENIVRTDLSALNIVAKWLMRYQPIRRRADVPALMQEFSRTLWEEMDYELEADNAERFAEMYANSDSIYIPAVYRQHSTKRIIVLENVEALKLTDLDGMQMAGINPREVAESLLDAYFPQIFEEGFFHADPHPGNLFVRPRSDIPWSAEDDNERGRPFWLIFIDFGMVGRVPEAMKQNLRKILVSVMQQDGHAMTEAYDELGFFLPDANLERISDAQSTILKRMWGRNWLDLANPDPAEMQELGQEFRDLLFDFPFQVPQDFIYLGRALGMMAGMVTQLDAEISPWYFFEKYGRTVVEDEQMPLTLELAWEMIKPYFSIPGQVRRIIEDMENGRLRLQSDREILRQNERIEKRIGQLGWSILGAAGMLSGTLIYLYRKGLEKKESDK